jgi:hypothetical protein
MLLVESTSLVSEMAEKLYQYVSAKQQFGCAVPAKMDSGFLLCNKQFVYQTK